jgi:tight adherence protein B
VVSAAALAAGVGVFAAAWLVTAPGGRRAVAALAAPGAAAVRARRPRRRGGAPADGGSVQVRVVVAQVAALLRSGAPPGAAWSRATGVPVDDAGVPAEAALTPVVGGAAHARSVVAATGLALEVGAPLGRVLEAVSDTLVAEAEAQAERDAALAGPRATARVLQWLPAAGALLGWVLGADPLATATDGGAGSAAVGLGLLLLAAGRWWTGRLVAAARRAGEAP